MKTLSLTLRLVFLTLLATTSLAHAAEPVSKSYFGGVAIEGHDTVAYHKIAAGEPPQSSQR